MGPRIPREMQAAVYHGKDDLRMEMIPVPRIGSGDLLVHVGACGVCPTDIKKVQSGSVSAPRVFGHETAGIVVRVGAKVRGFKVGDRVALHHHVPCLQCHYCRHRAFAQCTTYLRTGVTAGFEPAGGGFAQYVRVLPFCLPGVVRIPARNALVEGALIEPVNTVLKGIRSLPLLSGDTVVVVGQGPIGLMFNRLLTLAGMRVLGTDLLESRRRRGRRFGAFRTWAGDDPNLVDHIRRCTGGRGADAVVLTVPGDAVVRQAQDMIRGGGVVLLFAHTLRGHETAVDLARVCMDEKALVGSYSADFTLQSEVARLVFSRRLDVRDLVSHRFPLEQAVQAIATAAEPREETLKVVVDQTAGSVGK